MVPPEYANFFIAATGAGGALIGLLFVAVSIVPERTVKASAPVESRAVSSSTFVALFNTFFISLAAVLPHWNISYIVFFVSLIGVLDSLSYAWNMLRPWPSWQNVLRRIWLTLGSLFLYTYELVIAIQLLTSPADASLVLTLGKIIFGMYVVALLRAWDLLGAQRATSIGGWLNPLYEVNKRPLIVNTDQSDDQQGDIP